MKMTENENKKISDEELAAAAENEESAASVPSDETKASPQAGDESGDGSGQNPGNFDKNGDKDFDKDCDKDGDKDAGKDAGRERDGKYKKENRRLTEQLAEKEKALAEARDKYMRLAAEYDNFRKRSVKEKEGIYADAYSDCILALLPVADNLERALLFPEGEKVLEGVRMTMNQFTEALKKLGVEEIETKVFDPVYHNAVMHVEDEAFGEGEIVEVFQKGYKKGDKVIRHAMVKVAN